MLFSTLLICLRRSLLTSLLLTTIRLAMTDGETSMSITT